MYESEALRNIKLVKENNVGLSNLEIAFKLVELLKDMNDSKSGKLKDSDYAVWQNTVFNLFLAELHILIPPNSKHYNELILYEELIFSGLFDYFNTPRFED